MERALGVLIMVAVTSTLACGLTAVLHPAWSASLIMALFMGFCLSAIVRTIFFTNTIVRT